MNDKLVLVTGANGYIAGRLVPRLLEAGYKVRCMVRDLHKIAHQPWIQQVEVVVADVSEPNTLGPALNQVDTAFYLIHNMSKGHGYQTVERNSAKNFAQAAEQAGIDHIVYLGGLVDPKAKIAPHMRSRIETGEVLRQYPVPVTEFRAGVIVGPGSISFEMIRYLCEQFPILIGPSWLKNRTQPISSKNVVDYLIAALENKQGSGKVFEIGGPDTLTYAETITIYGECRHLKRRMLTVSSIPTGIMAYLVDRLTPVPAAIAYPLIEGLSSHSTVSDPKALEVFPEIELTGYRQAVHDSLSQLHPCHLERDWLGQVRTKTNVRSEGFLIDFMQAQIGQATENVYPKFVEWVAGNLAGFEPEEVKANSRILLKDTGKKFGERWVEWELLPQPNDGTLIRQTGFFAPKGLGGFFSGLWWKLRQRRRFHQICELLG